MVIKGGSSEVFGHGAMDDLSARGIRGTDLLQARYALLQKGRLGRIYGKGEDGHSEGRIKENPMETNCQDCEGMGTMEGTWAFDEHGNLISLDKVCDNCEGRGKVWLDEDALAGV